MLPGWILPELQPPILTQGHAGRSLDDRRLKARRRQHGARDGAGDRRMRRSPHKSVLKTYVVAGFAVLGCLLWLGAWIMDGQHYQLGFAALSAVMAAVIYLGGRLGFMR